MQAINSAQAPAALGPYSQAVLKHDTLYISGQLGIEAGSGQMAEGFEAQAEQALANLEAILAAAGMGFGQVVKVTVFLADLNNFAALNAIYARHFSAPHPAREAIQAARLPQDGMIEISAVAMK